MASAAHSPPPASFKSQKNQDAAQLRRSRTFRKIERDLADKSKRLNNDVDDGGKEEKAEKEASRRNDDLYIDKDRAIAVGAGNYIHFTVHT